MAAKAPAPAPAPKAPRIVLAEGQAVTLGSESYVIDKRLGSGGFGTVYKATRQRDNVTAAIKVIDVLGVPCQKYLYSEATIMETLNHPNIIRFLDKIFNREEQAIYIVMEYAEGGSLAEYIAQSRKLGEEEARAYFRQIISTLEYCHQKRIYHRDLKPLNILLDRAKKVVKLCDFGMGAQRVIEPGMPSPKLYSPVGTPYYKAPEVQVLTGWGYSGASADIWSCGVTLLVMVTGRQRLLGPYNTQRKLDFGKMVSNMNTLNFGYGWYMSPELAHLIRRLLEPTAELRIRIAQIKEHPWYTGDRRWIQYELVSGNPSVRPYRKALCVRFVSELPSQSICDFFQRLVNLNDRLSLRVEKTVNNTVVISDKVTGVSFRLQMLHYPNSRIGVEITHVHGSRRDFREFYRHWLKDQLNPLLLNSVQDFLRSDA